MRLVRSTRLNRASEGERYLSCSGLVWGPWPGLEPGQLYQERDLALESDYRDVMSAALAGHLGADRLDVVFPGYRVRRSFEGLIR